MLAVPIDNALKIIYQGQEESLQLIGVDMPDSKKIKKVRKATRLYRSGQRQRFARQGQYAVDRPRALSAGSDGQGQPPAYPPHL